MSPLLAVENLHVTFPQGGGLFRKKQFLQAVHDVSFEIRAGETLALVGESGSGKTTIGQAVGGLRVPTSGAIRIAGKDARSGGQGRKEAGQIIQMVFQDPFSALDPRMPVAEIIAEPLRIQGIGSKAERRARAAELVKAVGLPADALGRYPHAFSGGQRQRIAIARALAPEPQLIIADEPLSALDVSIQSQVLNLMKDLQEARSLSYLFISHDLGVVNHLADRVAVLYLGRLVETATREQLFETPAHPYTRAMLEAVPRLGRGRRQAKPIVGEMPSPLNPPPGCVFHTRCPKVQDVCRTTVPAFEPVTGRPGQSAACHFKD